MIKKVTEAIIKAQIFKDQKGSPAIETAALIFFIGLVVITKAGDAGTAIGQVFDNVVNGITAGF